VKEERHRREKEGEEQSLSPSKGFKHRDNPIKPGPIALESEKPPSRTGLVKTSQVKCQKNTSSRV